MVALAKVLKLQLHLLDVDCAFLYADLDEYIWMKPTPDIDIERAYCQLQKVYLVYSRRQETGSSTLRSLLLVLGLSKPC